MSQQDEKYMRMALKLARRGIGSVEPNPAVGCVIVKQGQVIGKGWHRKFAGPHAEINALQDCKSHGRSAKAATMYVTLEPCCHRGKTPPCTDAIIEAGLSKVVIAMIDPSAHAAGRGIEQLRQDRIEVETGLCRPDAELLNAPFIKFATTGRPWVILKWAQTIDGKMAWADKAAENRWLSNEKSRADAHKLRRRAGAILVGIETVLADDPLLTPRPARGKKPLRVVLDNHLRIPLDCRLLATAKKAPVLILTSNQAVQTNPRKTEQITQKGAEVLEYTDTQGNSNLNFLIEQLAKRSIAQLLIEGGPRVITSFLKEHLADEICIYNAPKLLCAAGAVDISLPKAGLTESNDLHHVDIKPLGDNVRLTGLLKKFD